ncbi:MAG: InlB B-repeat-containing protein, partial [Clostridia bacterium]|nr:InlB B-repeat-containing protein [Clostridia bacterium]
MKKKLTVATVLVLLLAVCLTMLVGCDDMFTKNEERDAMQVVATVNYEGRTENIYKFELATQFNNFAYAYHNYYNMSYESIADYLLQNLAQQKLLAMYAKNKVAQLMKLETVTADITELLSSSEVNHAIENANDSMFSMLKSRVEENITEDRYNNANSTTTPSTGDDEKAEITDPVLVRFESNGGSEVERQRIQKDTKAEKPSDPTKEGYTFYGWYENDKFEGDEFDFETAIPSNRTLYAKWVEYRAPRNEIPEVAEEDDYDPTDESVEISAKFYTYASNKDSADYKEKIYEKFLEEESVKTLKKNIFDNFDVNTANGATKESRFEDTLNSYILDNEADLERNLKENLFKNTFEECYNYILNQQLETVLVAKLERLIGESVEVTKKDVEAEFNRIKGDNEGTFTGVNADSNYSSALTSKLSETYYHLGTNEGSHGFVINILLKLDDESLKKLTDAYEINPSNT